MIDKHTMTDGEIREEAEGQVGAADARRDYMRDSEYYRKQMLGSADALIEQVEDLKRLMGDGVVMPCPYFYGDGEFTVCHCEDNPVEYCIMDGRDVDDCIYLDDKED